MCVIPFIVAEKVEDWNILILVFYLELLDYPCRRGCFPATGIAMKAEKAARSIVVEPC
jgi:hypothetical protein